MGGCGKARDHVHNYVYEKTGITQKMKKSFPISLANYKVKPFLLLTLRL